MPHSHSLVVPPPVSFVIYPRYCYYCYRCYHHRYYCYYYHYHHRYYYCYCLFDWLSSVIVSFSRHGKFRRSVFAGGRVKRPRNVRAPPPLQCRSALVPSPSSRNRFSLLSFLVSPVFFFRSSPRRVYTSRSSIPAERRGKKPAVFLVSPVILVRMVGKRVFRGRDTLKRAPSFNQCFKTKRLAYTYMYIYIYIYYIYISINYWRYIYMYIYM